jgi:alpha-tubulin suppressor-like RCC1 family protein
MSGTSGASGSGGTPEVQRLTRRLAAGPAHACVIDGEGALYCWGDNRYGQLGDGTQLPRAAPVRVGVESDWVEVSASAENCVEASEGACGGHTCGIRSDGSLWCWGRNWSGQLGDGGLNDRAEPLRVGGEAWMTVSTGAGSTCAIRADGALFCWGGQSITGFGFVQSYGPSEPMAVGSDSDWTDVGLGSVGLGCGVRAEGELHCWEESPYDVSPSDSGTDIPERRPERVSTFDDWVMSRAGGYELCGLRSDGSLWCSNRRSLDDFERIELEEPVHSLSRGWSHGCTAGNGRAFCWGLDADGELGDGTRQFSAGPREVVGEGWEAIAAGTKFSCGLRSDDSVWCWGSNSSGRLGYGVTPDKQAPTRVGSERWISLSTGNASSIAVRADGSFWSWGILFSYTHTYNAPLGAETTPVRLDESLDFRMADGLAERRCGIRNDGSLACWRGNALSEPGDAFESIGTYRDWWKLSVGRDGVCGIRRGGELHCVGYLSFLGGSGGVDDAGEPLRLGSERWREVAVSFNLACAIREDGTLWCWGTLGGNNQGLIVSAVPLQVGTERDWSDVAVSSSKACGLRTNGSVWCWDVEISERPLEGRVLELPMRRVGAQWTWTRLAGLGCALDDGDGLFCWTPAAGAGGGDETSPTRIAPEIRWESAAAGNDHVCGIDREQALWCWGENAAGQLGDGDAWRTTPVRVALH